MVRSAIETRVIQTEHELAALRTEWNDTLQASQADCLFLTWEWLSVWWRRFGSGRRLHIIEAREKGRLLGLAPLATIHNRLEFMGTGAVGSDYLDLIVRRDRATDTIDALARAIDKTGLHARFGAILPESTAHTMTRRLEPAYHVRERRINVCPFTPLSPTWETYIASLGARHRENVRRRIRKLPGNHAFTLTRTIADLEHNFPILLDLHQRRWSTRGGSDALTNDTLKTFHRDFTRLALERGWLRLFVLTIDDRPAAAVYAFRYGRKVLYYQAGVDPDYSAASVGLVALAFCIRHGIEEGAEEFDFLRGSEDYKFLWASQTRELRVLDLYRRSLGGRLTMHSHSALRAARKMARYVMEHQLARRSRIGAGKKVL